MPVLLAIIPLFVGYEFIASKYNESIDNTEREEREDYIMKHPENSVDNGQYASPLDKGFIGTKHIRLTTLTNWFSKKAS